MRTRAGACLLAPTGLTAVPSFASAEDAVHARDGFDFQLQLGYAASRAQVERSFPGVGNGTAHMTGHGVGGGLLFGAFLSPRVAIGGASLGGHSFAPAISTVRTTMGDFSFNVLGPYVSYYPRTDLGLHLLFQAGLGTTAKSTEVGYAYGSDDARAVAGGGTGIGFGGTVGIGYGAWVSPRAELGVMMRFQYARTNATDGPASFRYQVLAPALAATVSVH